MMKHIKYLLILALLLGSCQFVSDIIESYGGDDQQALVLEVNAKLQEKVELLAENAKLKEKFEGGVTEKEAAEIGLLMAKNAVAIDEISDDVESVRAQIEEIASDRGVSTGAATVGAALTGIVAMGMPTSGPLAGLLGGLAPLLEWLKLRNRRKRREYHAKRDKEVVTVPVDS